MKNHIIYISIIAFLLALLYYTSTSKTTITIPKIENRFKPTQPIYIEKPNLHFTEYITKHETVLIETKNPVNDVLASEYIESMSDSIKQLKMYLDAIQIRQFESIFEDDFLKLNIKGEVQGKVNSIFPEYEIKERVVNVKPSLRIGLGASYIEKKPFVSGSVLTNDFIFSYHLNLENFTQVNLGVSYLIN